MSKLTHDANAFARRVMMGAADLWVIVEGRDHDRPHYERLVEALPATNGLLVSVRLAEQIELDGVTAGGKVHALALHDHFHTTGELKQRNREGTPRMVFMLDRDRDDLIGAMRSTPHVIYTDAVDIEAEILANTDLWRALKSAYGIGQAECDVLVAVAGHPQTSLLGLWIDWVQVGLLSAQCPGIPAARFAQPSSVNTPKFGPPDSAKVAALRQDVESRFPDGEALAEARAKAHDYLEKRGHRVLKGRWVSRYMKALVGLHLAGHVVSQGVHPDTLVATGLEALDYSGAWASPYQTKFAELLAA